MQEEVRRIVKQWRRRRGECLEEEEEEAAAASVRARVAAQSGSPLGRPQARRAGQGRFFANTWRQVHWVREGGEKHIEDAEGSHVVT